MRKHPLDLLLEQGEHIRQDFKYFLSDTRKISRSLAAFANTEGGRLLIGVKDNGKVVGLKNRDEERHVIEAAASVFCKPAVEYTEQFWDYNGKTVLEIDIPKSDDAPHTAPDEAGRATVYIRVADENKAASRLEEEYLRMKHSGAQISLTVTPPEQRVLDYFRTNGLEFCIKRDYDIKRIARECIITPEQCLKFICKMALLEEEQPSI